MSRRVYEIARELDLSTEEVIGRLNEAGIMVKHHSTSVEDSVYERVFGGASDGAAPDRRPEAQEAEALPSRIQSPRKRLPTRRVLVYILAAALAFAVAASVGAMAALMLQGELILPASEKPGPSDQQGNTPQRQGAVADRSQQKEDAASQQSEAEYASKVGEIQAKSVKTFLDSHDKLMRYDAITAEDIEEMQSNQAALKEFTDQVDGLDPPEKYRDHYEVFRSAINELYEATKLAYSLANDPTAATKSEFDEHDRHVDEAAARLQQANKILGRDYKTLEGAHTEEVSPL